MHILCSNLYVDKIIKIIIMCDVLLWVLRIFVKEE